ncbi:hypothetical protein HY612_04305 [Candidatus Roizmanbacteria bacterium]|nr:hypothetical protein [Candidatus Roizmanbacteria bacterium]
MQTMYKHYPDYPGVNKRYVDIHIPLQIEAETRKIEKQSGDEWDYLKHIGTKLGWLKDPDGGVRLFQKVS